MYSDTNETILQYAPDYKVNLIAPGQMTNEEIGEFQSSLKEVLLYIKYSKDMEKLHDVTQPDEKFQKLERQAAEVLNVTTNSKFSFPEGKEEIDVCQAIEEFGLNREIKGAVEMCLMFNVSFAEAIQRICEKFNFSPQRSEEEVKKYWPSK